jgi:[ribosomal protein S18]-alanine N-acetyltransferase
LDTDAEGEACARIMATTDPWITLGRGYDECLAVVRDPATEAHVALDDRGVAGFILVMMRGAFVGYIRSVAVREDCRGGGLGSALIAHAEARILRDVPNVFLCVSSFNVRARSLYESLGYETIGELRDYIVRGHSEWLMRKTTGPILGARSDSAGAGQAPGAR